MELMLLLMSVLGSACSALFGARIYHKYSQNLLKSDSKFLDVFLGNPTIGALMITLLGAAGFCIPTAAFKEFVLNPSQVEVVNIRTPNVQPEFMHAVPLEELK